MCLNLPGKGQFDGADYSLRVELEPAAAAELIGLYVFNQFGFKAASSRIDRQSGHSCLPPNKLQKALALFIGMIVERDMIFSADF